MKTNYDTTYNLQEQLVTVGPIVGTWNIYNTCIHSLTEMVLSYTTGDTKTKWNRMWSGWGQNDNTTEHVICCWLVTSAESLELNFESRQSLVVFFIE
jgi:hypothetical protein